ncbi:response regulator transcription factor [Paenibacillus sp. 1011MAR3C5]|uniref:response regulator transcription factor n=1 Tax=Paenibacillus sp. 1011MAR3C5 TaxID=1675787 RepID=UPI0015FF8DB1|nr:response regulator transcription factor [Paenibacillus sp. 1011MAR3C5]
MPEINVLLVEDDPIWQSGISHYISKESDMKIIGVVDTANEALLQFQHADVVLMDINLTGNNLDGIQIAAEMIRIKPVKIIMLTVLTEKEIILEAFSAGAIHYMSKTNYKQLPAIIRSIMHDHMPIKVLLQDYARLMANDLLKDLTPAEREIFELLQQGYSQKTIGQMLFKAESTVKNQISQILKKLNVRSTKQALKKFERLKIRQ